MDKVYSVTEFSEKVKGALKKQCLESYSVMGEVSNKRVSNGNLYFTLKDGQTVLTVVWWNYKVINLGDRGFDNGDKVQVDGNLTVFSKQCSYNLRVNTVKILGKGDLDREYKLLKERYREKFEREKRMLPEFVSSVGVLTAKDGAALQDFLYVLRKNGFVGKVVVKDCFVQGGMCVKSVCEGLEYLDGLGLDVVVMTRGGGSFEDLFGFSSEGVLDVLFGMKTCVVSAIGHEVDFMLSDFMADVRAPTPSVAGEMVSKDKMALLVDVMGKIYNGVQGKINTLERELGGVQVDRVNIGELDRGLNNVVGFVRFHVGSVLSELELRVGRVNVENPCLMRERMMEKYLEELKLIKLKLKLKIMGSVGVLEGKVDSVKMESSVADWILLEENGKVFNVDMIEKYVGKRKKLVLKHINNDHLYEIKIIKKT